MHKKNKTTTIKKNIKCLCGHNIKKFVDFGKLPLINTYTKKKNSKKFPTILGVCDYCYLVQLKHKVNDNLIFPKNYPYLSGDSNEKIRSFYFLSNIIQKKNKNKKIKILDIGSNDGSFLEIIKQKKYDVLGIEPTDVANISIRKKIPTIKKGYNLNLAKTIDKKFGKFDFIVSTNFFAHTIHIKEILNSLHINLKKTGQLIIEVQYIYDLLKNHGFDSFHQDHKFYYSLSSLTRLLKMYNLYIFDAEIIKVHGEILRVFVSTNHQKETARFKKIRNKENDKEIFKKLIILNKFRLKFNKSLKNLIKNINSNKKTIVGLGAAPRSCVLINSVNLNSKYIKFIGEVPNSLKCNKYMPGTDILVKNENLILKLNIDYILILAWHLKSRMIKILKKNKFKGKFIVPLPKLSIFK